ncbi:hypothetical protein [Bradyrhizobium sp. LMTR 3]|uniref:hypothetical protein n=1 Tax=Bradyrhizobium sp. LMTR 3 TaxID=189873 RepID=UPI00114784FD|nr:hypothetical protein [Bradyrhizobium sp. LMTR 3]
MTATGGTPPFFVVRKQMPHGETEIEMARRHVAEQELRIERQRALIARLSAQGHSIEDAEEFLARMVELLDQMRAHVARLQ